ncbi:TlpA disulfide reductase family protein [Actinoplanes sp. N902-109]|uniref:TlpA family protein disulfide reductase n=1 Tax=Actinoplanes sp. (strain N902-109) TaxID=649831 RepID=UPI00032955C8|nr:TlpA disulfide reductase family protein [Actinoplanes sp. N902-109]AGL21410.1 redoxin domain-containing protein [Actinoplanes sp. N902-109]
MRPIRRLVPPLAVLLLAACTTEQGAPEQPSPFADCATLGGATAAADLPDVSLPCFTGGSEVELTAIGGPAVINLWGSWCGPCREELPVVQELADATAGKLKVLGVNTRDDRAAGASFAADHHITMPTLYDPDQKLIARLGTMTVPTTVFLTADGKRYVYTGAPLDKPALGALVRTHTGVTVAG